MSIVGIDLDNTILDATSAHLHYYNKASGLAFTPEDVNDFYLYRLHGWDEAERNAIYEVHGHDIHWNSLPLPMAVEVLRELFVRHRLPIITARPPLSREVTVRWLRHHGVDYHSIALTADKLRHCVNSEVDELIDDGPHYAEQFTAAGWRTCAPRSELARGEAAGHQPGAVEHRHGARMEDSAAYVPHGQ